MQTKKGNNEPGQTADSIGGSLPGSWAVNNHPILSYYFAGKWL